MSFFHRWYGAGPVHLIVLLASFVLTGYAALRLFGGNPVGIGVWFVGAIIAHDLLLFPLYSIADRTAGALPRNRAARRRPVVPWVNHLRFPAVVSGVLLLVWSPVIFRLADNFESTTLLSSDPFLERWLAITAGLFAVSAVAYVLRLALARRRADATPKPAPG